MAPDVSRTSSRYWRGVNHVIISFMHGVLLLTARREYRNMERIPGEGGLLVVSNHISHFDAFALPHAVRTCGRNPLGMGKIELFRIPLLGSWFAKIGHVSVDRAAATPSAALAPAAEALRDGKVLCMYPEGTINVTPELGLVVGRTGVARLALDSGVPVVPIGQWGPQLALTPTGRIAALRAPKLFGWLRSGRIPRRPRCVLIVGEPITAAELVAVAGTSAGGPDCRAVTDFVMTRIGALVAEASGLPQAARLDTGTPARTHAPTEASSAL
jgi:1-acyl-sn-glycerol-3-phosphate acyltransferase